MVTGPSESAKSLSETAVVEADHKCLPCPDRRRPEVTGRTEHGVYGSGRDAAADRECVDFLTLCHDESRGALQQRLGV